jgi:hypothetical protein
MQILPDKKRTLKIMNKREKKGSVKTVYYLKSKLDLIARLLILFVLFGAATSVYTQESRTPEFSERERFLLERIEQLEKRLEALEKAGTAAPATEQPKPAATQRYLNQEEPDGRPITAVDRGVLNFFRDTTINLTIDGYYGYNFNRPIGHINLLRAYDVQSNSFSLNQATLVVERPPNVDEGRRFGGRLDLIFGQATETLGGNPNNELRPQVYRHIHQAYGTYIVPIGNGLSVNFGKFASALGIEGNYTKDQINYSRSYYFNFLPFYHFGFHTIYNVNGKLTLTHWLVNGVQQSEDFNGFKSQALLVNVKPTEKISFNVNYFTGIEGKDSVPNLNPGFPTLPTQPGLPTQSIRPVPRGRQHIIDSYFTWNVTDKLTLAGEADYVISRFQTFSPPSRVTGGAAYARYQFTPKFALAGRAVYLSDRGGLFSGVTQALKDTTLTAEYKFADGFLMRAEYRRDFSNQPFFLTREPGLLKKEQNTATLGLVWWFGRKTGGW